MKKKEKWREFPREAGGKEFTRYAGSIPGSERSAAEGHGNPLQYSCLENLMDREPWHLKRLSAHTHTYTYTHTHTPGMQVLGVEPSTILC